MSQVAKEIVTYTSSQYYVMLPGVQGRLRKHVVVGRGLEGNLLFKIEFADNGHKLDIAEGDVYNNIQEVRVASIFGATFGIEELVDNERMADKSLK